MNEASQQRIKHLIVLQMASCGKSPRIFQIAMLCLAHNLNANKREFCYLL